MKKIILCEGKTDAVILSYFLNKCCKWEFTRLNKMNKFPVFDLRRNENIDWYKKNNDYLAIYSCGGIDNIPKNLKKISDLNSLQDDNKKFDKIVIMTDHDLETEDNIIRKFKNWLTDANIIFQENDVKISEWITCEIEYKKEGNNKEKFNLELLFIVIPKNNNGNLEVFLLDSLKKESDENKLIVNEAKEYIERLKDTSYLNKREKDKIKAQLQSVLSVISPEWVFSNIDERLKRINWENITEVAETYSKFKDL